MSTHFGRSSPPWTELRQDSLWNVQQAIDTIAETYEISADQETYNYRASVIFREFREQIEKYECSGGVVSPNYLRKRNTDFRCC